MSPKLTLLQFLLPKSAAWDTAPPGGDLGLLLGKKKSKLMGNLKGIQPKWRPLELGCTLKELLTPRLLCGRSNLGNVVSGDNICRIKQNQNKQFFKCESSEGGC